MKTTIKRFLAGVIALVAATVLSSSAWAGGSPTITKVEAAQGGSGKVEIAVTFAGPENDVAGLYCEFFATNTANGAFKNKQLVNVKITATAE